MKLTAKQKIAIIQYYPMHVIRFRADGTVEAKKYGSGVFGVRYSPDDTIRHLRAVGLLKA